MPSGKYWDQIAEKSLTDTPIESWRAYMQTVYHNLLQRWLPQPITGQILKTDLFEEAISKHWLLPALGADSIGLDLSVAIVANAQQRLRAANQTSRLFTADLRALPLSNACLDYIFSGSSLDHFNTRADITISLQEFNRVLINGGSLIITLDNPHNPLIRLRNWLPFTFVNRLGLVPYYVGPTLNKTELRQQLTAAGFEIEALTAVAHAPRILAIWLSLIIYHLKLKFIERLIVTILERFELLAQLPTRFFTGYYLAVKAHKVERQR